MKKDSFQRFAETLKIFFPEKEVLYVFEMGAKDCDDTLKFAREYPQVDIYAFECNTETLPQCRKAVSEKNKIHLVEKAVSDIDGVVNFYPIDTEKTKTSHADGNPGASSLFKASGKYAVEHYVQKETRVTSTRLDTFMNEHRIPGIDVLWLDAQGAELKILQGLGKKIRTVRIIQTEVEFMDIYSGQPLAKDVRKFLEKNGFVFVKYALKGKYFGDAIFVNKDVATLLGFIRRISKIRIDDMCQRIISKWKRIISKEN